MAGSFSQAITEAMPPDDGGRVGTVLSVNPLVVSVQGAEIPLAGQLPGSLAVGDPVALLRQDQSWLAMGAVQPPGAPADRNISTDTVLLAGSDSTTSATFVPVAGTTTSFTRYRQGSRLEVDFKISLRQTGGAAVVAAFGLQITNPTGETFAPTLMPSAPLSVASNHTQFGARNVFTAPEGLGTGIMSVVLLWRRVSGAGTPAILANTDVYNIVIEEL